MLDSYVFVHKDKLDEIEGCGMKLSLWADRRVVINGEEKNFISSLLNPRDNMDKYKSKDFKAIKLEVDMLYCYVAEGFLFKRNFQPLHNSSLYEETIIPAKDYVFGMYRQPECLIAKTILPNEMKIPGKGLSFPLFYESSESLYLNKIMQSMREENPRFDDIVLYYYFDNLAKCGEVEKVTDEVTGIAAFSLKDGRKPVVLTLFEQEALLEG